MITFDNVEKRYPDGTVAVDGLSLEVPTGTLTVLVGPSGCGKTTSLRMINRMVDPTAGRVLLDGKDVREQDRPGETLSRADLGEEPEEAVEPRGRVERGGRRRHGPAVWPTHAAASSKRQSSAA